MSAPQKTPISDLHTKKNIIAFIKQGFRRTPEETLMPLAVFSTIAYFKIPALTGLLGVGKAILIGASTHLGMLATTAPAIAIGSFTGFQISKLFKKSEKAQAIGTAAGACVIGLAGSIGGVSLGYSTARYLLVQDQKKPITAVFNKQTKPQDAAKTFVLTPQAIAKYKP